MDTNLKTFPELAKKRGDNHWEYFGDLLVYKSEIYDWKKSFEEELRRSLDFYQQRILYNPEEAVIFNIWVSKCKEILGE